MNNLILARRFLGVEAALASVLILTGTVHAAEQLEPQPLPQVHLDEAAGPTTSEYDEARQFLAKRKWVEAAIVLKNVVQKHPEYFAASLDLARALVYSGRREEALGILKQDFNREKGPRKTILKRRSEVLSRIFLSNPTFQLHQDGMNLLLAKKLRPAREKFEKALEQEPDNVEILTRLGQCLVLDGDYDSAAERLRLAKRLNPYEPEVRLWLGRALHQRGELTEALMELRSADDELEGSELAPIWLAEALNSVGQRGQAITVLDEDSKSQPYHVLSLLALARLRTQDTKDSQAFWSAKKDLQVALSRLPSYGTGDAPRLEHDLALEPRRPSEEIKTEIDKQLKQVEGKLEELNAG